MRNLRPILALVLALALTLTGQSMAMARGATDATGQMVICTGAGIVVVHVDEDGNPTGPPHICPDCALTAMTGLAMPDTLPLPATGMWAQMQAAGHHLSVPATETQTPQARGPPLAA